MAVTRTTAPGSAGGDLAALHIRIWDWEQAEVVATIGTWAEAVAFDPDGTRIATGHLSGIAKIWDIHPGSGS